MSSSNVVQAIKTLPATFGSLAAIILCCCLMACSVQEDDFEDFDGLLLQLLYPTQETMDMEPFVREAIEMASEHFERMFNLRIAIGKARPLGMSREEFDRVISLPWRDQLLALSQFAQSVRPEKQHASLVIFQADDNGAHMLSSYQSIVCYIANDDIEHVASNLFHEIAHLFHAVDVIGEDDIMGYGRIDFRNRRVVMDVRNHEIVSTMVNDFKEHGLLYSQLDQMAPELGAAIADQYKKILPIASRPHSVHLDLGHYYRGAEQFQEALEHYTLSKQTLDEWIESDAPTLRRAHGDVGYHDLFRDNLIEPYALEYYIAACLRGLGDYPAAEKAFLDVLESAPKEDAFRFSTLRELSILYFHETSQYENSLHSYRKLLDMAPEFKAGWFGLGLAYLVLTPLGEMDHENIDHAIPALQTALEIDPEYVVPRMVLGLVLTLKGDMEQGMPHIEQALQSGAHPNTSFEMQGGKVQLDAENARIRQIPNDASEEE